MKVNDGISVTFLCIHVSYKSIGFQWNSMIMLGQNHLYVVLENLNKQSYLVVQTLLQVQISFLDDLYLHFYAQYRKRQINPNGVKVNTNPPRKSCQSFEELSR